MIRWRCFRRACNGKNHIRKSTKTSTIPKCPKCKHPMRIDHNRTSRREKRMGNCWCGVVKFKAGAPHQRNYCRNLAKRQFEES